MTSKESQYADILVIRWAQRNHCSKETEILQTEVAKLGCSDREIDISNNNLPKGSALHDQFILIF